MDAERRASGRALDSACCATDPVDALADPRTLRRRTALWQPQGRSVLVLAGTAPGLLRDSLVAGHAGHGRVALTGWSALLVLDALGRPPWSAFHPDTQPWLRATQHLRLAAKIIRREPGNTTQRLGVRTMPYAEAVSDVLRFTPSDDARALAYRLAQHHGHARLSQLLADSIAVGEATGNANCAPSSRIWQQGRNRTLSVNCSGCSPRPASPVSSRTTRWSWPGTAIASTSPSPQLGSRSRSTAGRFTPTRARSSGTEAGRTTWWPRDGGCCASPGRTSSGAQNRTIATIAAHLT